MGREFPVLWACDLRGTPECSVPIQLQRACNQEAPTFSSSPVRELAPSLSPRTPAPSLERSVLLLAKCSSSSTLLCDDALL